MKYLQDYLDSKSIKYRMKLIEEWGIVVLTILEHNKPHMVGMAFGDHFSDERVMEWYRRYINL